LFYTAEIQNLSTDKGKPAERQGRKAIGPNALCDGSLAAEGRDFL